MKTANYTQKQIIKHLDNVVNNTFGGVFVPLHLAEHVRNAGAAIGLCICSGFYDADNNAVVLYVD